MIKNLSQILITKEPEDIPPLIQGAIKTVRNVFNDCSYTLYDNEKIVNLIKNNIGEEALKAYKKINPYANKASFARYCIIFLKGGWYVDLSIKMSSQMIGQKIHIPDEIDFLGFKDFGDGFIPSSLNYSIQNSIFYSKPNNKILQKAIEIVIENCKKENFGVSPICTTGPGVLGRAYASIGAKETHSLGMFMPLTPYHQNMNRSYILPDGTIFALHKNAWMPGIQPADISAFGFKTSNNYIKMWKERDGYYDKSIIMD